MHVHFSPPPPPPPPPPLRCDDPFSRSKCTNELPPTPTSRLYATRPPQPTLPTHPHLFRIVSRHFQLPPPLPPPTSSSSSAVPLRTGGGREVAGVAGAVEQGLVVVVMEWSRRGGGGLVAVTEPKGSCLTAGMVRPRPTDRSPTGGAGALVHLRPPVFHRLRRRRRRPSKTGPRS